MKSSKRLGRGLNALIPTEGSADGDITTSNIQELDVLSIETNPRQPRVVFDNVSLQELKDSIKEKGVVQPILVRPIKNGKYQIVYGERRFKATCELGLQTIPAYIKEIESDEDVLEIQLIENVQRDNLNPIDLANGYQRLMEECNLTQEDVAKRIGKDRTTVANAIRLLKLPKVIQESLQQGKIKEGHARAILSISDQKSQKEIWRKTLKNSLSVRRVEQLVKKYQKKQNEQQPKETPTKSRKSSYVSKAETKLREKFGTQVKIRTRRERGTVEISFYSPEDLQRLMEIFDQIKY